jgi:hypothetical protein
MVFVFLKARPNVSNMSMGFLPRLELTNQSFAKFVLTRFEQIWMPMDVLDMLVFQYQMVKVQNVNHAHQCHGVVWSDLGQIVMAFPM